MVADEHLETVAEANSVREEVRYMDLDEEPVMVTEGTEVLFLVMRAADESVLKPRKLVAVSTTLYSTGAERYADGTVSLDVP